jgi:alpha-beta hydrolase superfamily lysophospholipase
MSDGPADTAPDEAGTPAAPAIVPGESPIFAMSLDEPSVPEPIGGESADVEQAAAEAEAVAPDVEPEAEPGVVEPETEPLVVEEPAVEEPAVETTAPLAITPPADHAAIEAPPLEAAIAAAPAEALVPAAAAVPAAPAPVMPVSHAAARRRRWPWVTLVCILLALLLVAGAGLWYVSGLIGAATAVPQDSDPFPLTVLSVGDTSISYSGTPGGWDDQGLMGIGTAEGGYVQTQSPQEVGAGDTMTTTRQVSAQVLLPPPAAGQAAALDGWFFPSNPQVGLGVEYQDVVYPSPSGPTPAWYIPGTSSTWVIFTHGRGATPREGLRIASTVTKLGYPMLLIKYRDDERAPQEDDRGNFGATEWPDLEAAVKYALDHGASKVVLSGASMGAAITLAFLQNSALAPKVVGVFLDSPATNFGAMVESGAADMGLPGFVTAAAKQVAAWRFGIDWQATDHTRTAGALAAPTLIVQGTEDTRVPAKVTEAFAKAAPTRVQLELFEGAGHVMSWNVDRSRYESLLSGFLTKVAP